MNNQETASPAEMPALDEMIKASPHSPAGLPAPVSRTLAECSRWLASRPLLGRALIALVCLSWTSALVAQNPGIEEEDLADLELSSSRAAPARAEANEDLSGLEQQLDQVKAAYRSADLNGAALGLERLVTLLESRLPVPQVTSPGQGPTDSTLPAGPPSTNPSSASPSSTSTAPADIALESTLPVRTLLARTLLLRAALAFDLGQEADPDLERLIQTLPSFDPQSWSADLELVSPKLMQRFDALRRERLASLDLQVEPPDATVRLAGYPLRTGRGPVSVPAGQQTLEISRPGYQSLVQDVELRAGRTLPLQLTLERDSAVLRLSTKPAGAEVWIDGQLVGTTVAAAAPGQSSETVAGPVSGDGQPGDTGASSTQPGLLPRALPPGFSAELVLAGLEIGPKVLEVRKEGYRVYRRELQLGEQIDYRMPPVALDRARGELVLRGLPRDSEVRIDGRPVIPEEGNGLARMELLPGSYDLMVLAENRRVYRRQLQLADRQVFEVPVRLRPALTLLGVLAAPQTARELGHSLTRNLEDLERWTLLDHQDQGMQRLVDQGLDAGALRAMVDNPSAVAAVNWGGLRQELARNVPGLVYAVAVPDNDLVPTALDLWMWPAAPAAARPDRLRLPVSGDTVDVAELKTLLQGHLPLSRPWLGALLADSESSEGPVVASVVPEGPADVAGLQVGDVIAAVGGVSVKSRRELELRVLAAAAGDRLELALLGSSGSRTTQLDLGRSPLHLSPIAPGPLPALIAAELMLMEQSVDDSQAWLVKLDQALLLLAAGEWQRAAERLRGLRAPQTSHGLGQAAVDYWLGVALANDPDLHPAAIAALRRAAALEGARLEHNDGPYLAPRARIRLRALGAGF